MNWQRFFPKGTPVLALPSWRRPRLYVNAWNANIRWVASGLYPASKMRARVYKLWLRIRATLPWEDVRRARGRWELENFLNAYGERNWFPSAVLVGTEGPTQKITIELRDPGGRVVAYLKYGESRVAQKRISRERSVLESLPEGLAPRALHFGRMGDGVGLLVSAVHGRRIPARVSLPDSVVRYAASLPASNALAAVEHPWISSLCLRHGGNCSHWISALSSRKWDVMLQHGDFAPWNMFLCRGRVVCAIDWEFGNREGFPGTDLAYYLLHVMALIKRWSPGRSRSYAINLLTRLDWPGLTLPEAGAIVRLTALDAYYRALSDGHDASEPLQQWRRAVVEDV